MKIGFIGLGTMGMAMCENIVRKHKDTVYAFDIDREKISRLEAEGAAGCRSALEAAENSEIVITMLPRTEHVTAVWEQLLPTMRKGKIGIDMSTIDPEASVRLAERVREETGAEFADCPVVKSKAAAQAGELGIFAGCSREVFQTVLPVLRYMGTKVIHMGENGKGIKMKICQNALSHEIQAAVNETLTLAMLNGISVDAFAEAVSCGGARNYYLESKYEAIREKNYDPAFPVEYAIKDLNICRCLAENCGFSMPGLENALYFLNKAERMGYAKADNCACIEAVWDGTGLESGGEK